MKNILSKLEPEVKALLLLLLILLVSTAGPGVIRWASADTATGGTASFLSVPAAPAVLNAVPGACGTGTIVLSWPASFGATGYYLYRDSILIRDGTVLTYTDIQPAGSTHYYSVKALNTSGMSSAIIVIATAPALCHTDVSNTDSDISTSTLATTTTAVGTITTTTSSDASVSTTASATASTFATETSTVAPTPTTTYTYIPTVPLAPSGLKQYTAVTATPTIVLHWADNAWNEDKVNVERKLSTASAYTFLNQITGSAVTSYIDKTVVSGVSYDYRVQACLSGTGCSAYAYLYHVSVPSVTSTTTALTGTSTTIGTDTVTTATTSPVFVKPAALATSTTPILTSPTVVETTILTAPLTTTKVTAPEETVRPTLTATTTEKVPETVTPVVVSTTTLSVNIEYIGTAVEELKIAVADTNAQLVQIINDSVARIVETATASGQTVDTVKVFAARDELLKKVTSSLADSSAITPSRIDVLKIEISKGIERIKLLVGPVATSSATVTSDTTAIANTVSALSATIATQTVALKAQGADLLYKDTNKDGISDYDSVNLYKLDPVKPSPVSTYEGKVVNAADKVVLGFDPTKKDLVKVNLEQPASSTAPVLTTYKVEDVALTVDKKLVLKGVALPNSFITLYIYSTPIMVTVKANSQGEWQYTLDKELENGEHTVYTASVNNSGNIVAKSNPYPFTKTAEAAALREAPAVAETAVTATDMSRPELFEGFGMYLFILGIVLLLGIMLIIIGSTKKP